MLPPKVTSWLSIAGATRLLQQCLQVYGKQVEARVGKRGGAEQSGWTKCPEQREKIEIPEGTLPSLGRHFEGLF